jgi:hypothetical protein
VNGQPAFPYSENGKRIFPEYRQVAKGNIIKPRPYNRSDDGIKKKVLKFFFANAFAFSFPTRQPITDQTGQGCICNPLCSINSFQ